VKNIGRLTAVDLCIIGDVRATLAALLPLLDEKRDDTHLTQAPAHGRSSTISPPAHTRADPA
jgi:pyruvate dehydrogenase (quinone)